MSFWCRGARAVRSVAPVQVGDRGFGQASRNVRSLPPICGAITPLDDVNLALYRCGVQR